MPSIHISEHTNSGRPEPTYPPLAVQVVPIGAVSQQSKPFGGDTRIVVLQSDVACRIAFAGKADETSIPLTPNVPRPFPVSPGDMLAVIEADAPAGADSLAGLIAIVGDPRAAEKRMAKITASQKALDASIAENRALAEKAASDRAAADAALAEANKLTSGFEAKVAASTAQIDQRNAQLAARQTVVENGELALAVEVKQREAALADLEATAAARETETAALLEQARKDAADAAAAKAEWTRRVASARKLVEAE